MNQTYSEAPTKLPEEPFFKTSLWGRDNMLFFASDPKEHLKKDSFFQQIISLVEKFLRNFWCEIRIAR